jgi:hypothetical protein
MNTYNVKIIREAGGNPFTGQVVGYAEQSFEIDAIDIKAAYSLSYLVCTLKFSGQIRRTFINGEEYFNERY